MKRRTMTVILDIVLLLIIIAFFLLLNEFTASAKSIKEKYPQIHGKQQDILERIVEAEAGEGTMWQKVNVASCVMNRVKSSDWPNTIEGVVFQNGQFSPVSDGGYARAKITEDTKRAVQFVKIYGSVHKCIFFCSYSCKSKWFNSKGEPTFRDGIHRYYLR